MLRASIAARAAFGRSSRCTLRAPIASTLRRGLCTAPTSLSDKADEQLSPKLPSFVNETLTGVGQVIFLGSPSAGAVTLAALTYGDPWLGTLAALGTVTATASAHACRLDPGAISAGLMGYNGCLVGCAFSVFLGLPAWSPAAAAAAVMGAAVSAPVVAALKAACGNVPQFTLAFNICTLSALFAVRPLAGAAPADPATAISAMEWICSPLVGISQIFVVNDAISGALILGAIGMYSPMCAAHTLLGSCIGVGTGLALGAPAAELGMGLWGFNPALTALSVSVFFVPGMPSYALATGGAAATAALFGGAKVAMGTALGVPALTLPFCAVAAGCHLLHQSSAASTGLLMAANPHSPEKNAP